MNTIKKIFLIILCSCSVSIMAQSHSGKRYYANIEFRHYRGIAEKTDVLNAQLKKHYGNSLRLSGGFYIDPHFSLGAGIGADSYFHQDMNTLPVFVEAKGLLYNSNNTPYIYGLGGYAVKLTNNFTTGYLFETGLGYKFKISNLFNGVAFAGYKFFAVPDYLTLEKTKYYLNRHSVVFGIGLGL